jgi:hypothetical protein
MYLFGKFKEESCITSRHQIPTDGDYFPQVDPSRVHWTSNEVNPSGDMYTTTWEGILPDGSDVTIDLDGVVGDIPTVQSRVEQLLGDRNI